MLTRLTDRNYCRARPMSPFGRKIRLRCPQILLVRKRRLLKNRGQRIRQPPSRLRLRSGFPQAAFAIAATATAGVTTLTLICFGLVSSRFGMCNVSAPF